MAAQILMPALSPTMEKGNIVRWLKAQGDLVKAGDLLAEIETDKAIVEFEAVEDGYLAKILVPAGSEDVPVNTPIALLASDGEKTDEATHGATVVSIETTGTLSEPQNQRLPDAGTGGRHRVRASPLARRLATQLGVKIDQLRGSGPDGRIVKADVEAAGSVTTSYAQAEAPTKRTEAPHEDRRSGANSRDEDFPHSNTRRTIAKRLMEAKSSIPHFYVTIDCTVDTLLDLRAQLNLGREARLSINDFVVKAVAMALAKVPSVNATWTDDAMRHWRDIDVAVAVAAPTGLITPIIRSADTKTVGAISAEIRDLAGRAREAKLRPEEFQGGSFTISNLGMYGIRNFAAIVNPPHAAILAVGATEERPVVRGDEIVIANVMTCTLSVDHRIVDGALASEYLKVLKGFLEAPLMMLV